MNTRPHLPGSIVSAILILAIGQLACIILERELPPTLTSAEMTAMAPTPGFAPSANPKADVFLAYKKQQSAYPYKVTERSTSSSSPDTNVRVKEAAGPGEQHVTWTLPESGEMIETGGMFYLLLGGEWTKSDVPPLDMPTEVDLASYVARGLIHAQLVGPDSSIGVEAYAYLYTTNLDGNAGAGKVWLASSSGLPYKATYKTARETYTFTAELVYEYGIEVVIQAPIP